MDDSPDITPSQGESNPQVSKRRGRGPTRLKKFLLRYSNITPSQVHMDDSPDITPSQGESNPQVSKKRGRGPTTLKKFLHSSNIAPSQVHMDDSPDITPSQGESNPQVSKKRGRGPTTLKKFLHSSNIAPSQVHMDDSPDITPSQVHMDDSPDITPSQGESNPQVSKKRGRGPTTLKKFLHSSNIAPSQVHMDDSPDNTPSQGESNPQVSKKRGRGPTTLKKFLLHSSNIAPSQVHMDDSPEITPSQGESNPQFSKKRGRGPTTLKKLRLKHVRDQKISIEFDQSTGNAKGPNRTQFNNYVSFLARSRVSILHEDWDHVEESVKNMIWQTILLNYDIPNSEFLKKKLISYAGQRWRAFKSQLSGLYIYGKYKDKSPCEKYTFLEEEMWQRFVQSRLDPAFEEKRKKAQEVQANNLYPHTLSCGGYQKLEENMMKEKAKQIQEASQLDPSLAVVEPPSPLKRHEKWKRARQKKSGDYVNEEARLIAEKIDSLVEQSTQGSFVPLGREDILTTAIGQPEHPGRVRGAGRGVGIRQYFGPPPRNPLSTEDLAVITQLIQEQVTKQLSEQLEHKLKADLSQQFQQEVRQELASLGLLPQNTNFEPAPSSPVHVSTKGNHATLDPSVEDNHTNIHDQCELYVDVDPPCLVAIGKVYNLGSTIHHKAIEDDNVRVVVEEVRDAEARVPLPTNEVQTVGQAPNQFIQWPRRLVKSISVKTIVDSSKDVPHKRLEPQLDPLERLLIIVSKLRKDHVQLPWDPDVLSKPSTIPFHIYRRDIFELCMGSEMLNISVIQLWLMYLHSLCTDKGNAHIYGFMDPQSIQSVGNNATEVQGFLQSRLHESKKQCYLAPYLHSDHWQLLIICPKQNIVVLLCSLHKKTINKEMKTIVDLAMDEYQRLMGSQSKSRRKKPTWILPRCQTQSKDYECGYYVMKQMLTIVTVDIVDSWKQLFNNLGPFPEEDIADIQQRWAAFLLKISNL